MPFLDILQSPNKEAGEGGKIMSVLCGGEVAGLEGSGRIPPPAKVRGTVLFSTLAKIRYLVKRILKICAEVTFCSAIH